MRLATATVVAGFTMGSVLLGTPAVAGMPGSVTVCAKGLTKGGQAVSVEVGFTHGEGQIARANSLALGNNQCLTIGQAPAPSGAWVDADRQAKRIVVKTPSGKTHVKKSDRADFTLSSGDNVTVTFWFGAK